MKNSGLPCEVEFHSKPDSLGRQAFTLKWVQDDGVFRPELSKEDGKPIGRRRAQVFFAVPEDHVEMLTLTEGKEDSDDETE